jgi:tetratricopeptide (TPR) repeat protein
VPQQSGDRLQRLTQAMEAYLAWQESGAKEPAAFLSRHETLRDLLEPMLAENGAPAEAKERVLGDFRLLREIGRGGMGVVHEAVQISLDRRVALKVLPTGVALKPAALARFKREAMTAGRLAHPGIVEVYAVGSSDDTHYFAMELVKGTPLHQLRERPPSCLGSVEATGYPWSRTQLSTLVRILAQVADALHHAHELGVVHRDVKPSNILVRDDGSAVLTDFGLAADETLPSLSHSGSFAGTPYYIAPERIRGKGGPADRRCDVFSLGATLYELVTLRRPFDGETTHAILSSILTDEPLDPQRINPQLPADLAAIVLKALEKDPRDRYQTCAALADDLRAFLALRPVSVHLPAAPTRLMRWLRRSPLRAALVIVLALCVPTIAGLGVFLAVRWPQIEAGRQRQRDEELQKLIVEAELELSQDRPAKALPPLQRARELAPEDVDVLSGRVIALARLRQHDGALGEIEASRGQGLDPFACGWLRAYVLRSAGQTAEAEALAATLPAPTRGIELYLHGLVLLELSRGKDTKLLREAEVLLRRAVLATANPRPPFVFCWAKTAAALKDEQACDDAVAAIEARWPESGLAWFWIGRVRSQLDPKAGIAAYRRALALGLDRSAVHYELGVALERSGDKEQAVQAYRRAVELDPAYELAQTKLGYMLIQLGDYEGACRAYERALKDDPGQALAHNGLGSALERLGKHAEAEACYRKALSIDPDYATALRNLGSILIRKGGFAESERHLARFVALQPDSIEGRGNLGYVRMQLGDVDGAEEMYRAVLADKADEPVTLTNYGLMQLELGQVAEATAKLERAVTLDPKSFFGLRGLGRALIHPQAPPELRDAKRALDLVERCQELRGEDEPTLLHLQADAELAAGRAEAALATIERAMKLVDASPQPDRSLFAHMRASRLRIKAELER